MRDETRFGPYVVFDVQNRSGEDVLYLARDGARSTDAVLRVIKGHRPEALVDELSRLRRLVSPQIVPILDVGRIDDRVYVALAPWEAEYVRLAKRTTLVPEKWALLKGICAGLAAAHAAGVVHGDLHPGQIRLARGPCPQIDFSYRAEWSEGARLIRFAAASSPETIFGKSAGRRSDVFSLAHLAYELLTGRSPFEAATIHGVYYRLLHESPPPPREIDPHISAALAAWLLRGLEKKPADRFADAREMLGGLEDALQASSLPPDAKPSAGDHIPVDQGPGPVAWLVFHDRDLRRAVPLRSPGVVIGRDSGSCDVWLKDFGISRVHARIDVGPLGTMTLTDLKSKGGSFVNERPVATAGVAIADQLRLGQVRIAIAAEPPADATPEAAPATYAGKQVSIAAEPPAVAIPEAAPAAHGSRPETPYRLLVDDNFHYMDSEKRTHGGSFATLEAAVAAAKAIVDDYLVSAYHPGMAAQELLESYTSFGEDPWISSPDGRVPFSAWDYARARSGDLSARGGNGPAPQPDLNAVPAYPAETVVELQYSRDGRSRAIITLDQRGRLHVHRERWNVSRWGSERIACWDVREGETPMFAETLERARSLAHQALQPGTPRDDATESERRCARCWMRYRVSENGDDVCRYHPGQLKDCDRCDAPGLGLALDFWDCCNYVLATNGDPSHGCAAGRHVEAARGDPGPLSSKYEAQAENEAALIAEYHRKVGAGAPERVSRARRLVEEFLAGLRPGGLDELQEEDVAVLEGPSLAWLIARARNAQYPLARRRAVARVVKNPETLVDLIRLVE